MRIAAPRELAGGLFLGFGVLAVACSSDSRVDAPATSQAGSSTGGGGGSAGGSSTAGATSGGSGGDSLGGSAGLGGSSGAATGGAGAGGTSPNALPPNVVIIVADDMGYSDVGAYGGEIDTPNVDALADNGVRFTNFYNSSRCSPTRASMLTGQYPHRVNLAQNGRDLGKNGLTIAEALGSAGYNTGMAGKWHLSATPELDSETDHLAWLAHQLDPGVPFSPDPTTYPVGRGFQRHYGPIWGV
ncbi:MAG TPA: sulfatase-like hydrolase/transferase, partial [Polyangiaceae bacterium]|nr:sulfatase-like hydrolase/transferase [Polyangiaceae bacterium]